MYKSNSGNKKNRQKEQKRKRVKKPWLRNRYNKKIISLEYNSIFRFF